MTGRFETLIYTDCREGQGLRGTPGLQFQARSAGADRGAEAVVQRNLLYEPPSRWMRERRPVSEYPVSFAHVWDGMFATASGIYLGRESVGGREGNQLTHAIVTTDAAAYGLVRPAQLFGAPFWTAEPAPDTRCPPLEPGWQPGSFGPAEARAFVQAAPDGAELLTALLSTLRAPAGQPSRRVLFVAREPAQVLRWVTAATLLLPQREALRIGFKVFTLNPAYAPQQILAVHPDWGGAGATLDNDQGYAVFDLVRHDWSRVAADRAARRWVHLFLAEDPLDVVDAVEVAAASGAEGEDATGVALAAILRRLPPREEVGGLVRWLRQGPPPLVRRYGGDIVDLLVATAPQWPVDVLRGLDDVSRAASFPHRGAAVRLALVDAELREVMSSDTVRADRAAPTDGWTPTDEARALGPITEAMRAAEPLRFEALLRLCGRFGLRPPLTGLQPGLDRFVLDWADHPERAYQFPLWACAEGVERLLRQELGQRLTAEPDTAYELGDQWWDVLLREPMRLDEPLDAAVVEAALRNLPHAQQLDLIEQCLRTAVETDRPAVLVNRTAAVIWTHRPVGLAEAHLLRRLLPRNAPLDPRIFAASGAVLVEYDPDPQYLEAALLLVAYGLWSPPPEVARAIAACRALAGVLDQLARSRPDIGRLTLTVQHLPPQLVSARLRELCDALAAAPAAAAAFAVLTHATQLIEPYSRKVRAELMRSSTPAHVALAFVLVHLERQSATLAALVPPGIHADLDRKVRTAVARCSQKRLDEMTAQVEGVGPMWSAQWRRLVGANRRGLLRRLRRGGRG
ncbi:GTPase-associated protein 1-related protein [Micromonospora sp. DT62]|uniref:GTPase-associated protein 1-related protein n=1 Tax=Micromonospora sp. DT62 TaxID=3416521 RepID=UPI003CE69340